MSMSACKLMGPCWLVRNFLRDGTVDALENISYCAERERREELSKLQVGTNDWEQTLRDHVTPRNTSISHCTMHFDVHHVDLS
ncbi:hypothetical protein VN97_g11664 [Penicillium thymicola]|uniref:Uncharacterized protein n=1 Tax=Penicillium thymicola TaxID=293382 RepID=A0AAI9T6N1_PENTH|nr:hypothetical protein VN97_g11664 [Penicillium thymicola]